MEYAFPVSGMLKALKFRRQQFFAPALGDLLISALEDKMSEVDAILPVPLHRWRHFQRGFNQASEIARPLARRYGLPLITSVRRRRATLPQSGLSTAEREKNLRHVFVADRHLACRYPLIVDDVITTGSTINQLASVLLAAGAQRVAAAAVARAVLHG
jgi:ComF family protein